MTLANEINKCDGYLKTECGREPHTVIVLHILHVPVARPFPALVRQLQGTQRSQLLPTNRHPCSQVGADIRRPLEGRGQRIS